MECTVWRPVEGFNGKYMVSDAGDVLNSETGKKLTHRLQNINRKRFPFSSLMHAGIFYLNSKA